MSDPKSVQESDTTAGHDAYAEVATFSKKLTNEMLVRMIDSAANYRDWNLSADEGERLVKLIKYKQRIICSTFAFQLNRNFADFKAANDGQTQDDGLEKPEQTELSGANANSESEALEAITQRHGDAFKSFDTCILKRLQTCIRRSRANRYENPLQLRRLCAAYSYAVDSLNLEAADKLALYQLFADRFIDALGPLYRRIDQLLFDHGMLPDMPAARIQLRNPEGLSESQPPSTLKLNQSACLLVLLQQFKEKSRTSASHFQNYFPDLKQSFGRYDLNDYDEQIDQLNLIFKLIFEDEDLPLPVKQQLSRLQAYVFITAIQEDGFLRRSSNPARRLLDGIISNEVEITKNGNADFSGVHFIQEHIDSMTALQFITVEHYSQMLEGYLSHVKENETSIRRKRKLEATRKVLPLVKERLAEITQPLRIQGTPLILFEKVWLPLMVQIALQNGMDSEPWHKALTMVKKQVWSLIPKTSPEEQAELLEVLPIVAHSLHRAMRSLKLAESLQQSLRDFLKLEQQNVAEETARSIIEAKRKTRSLSAQSFASEDDTTEFDEMMQTGVFQIPADMLTAFKSAKPEPPKKINQAQALKVGDWVYIKEGEDRKLAKLAWKAEDSMLFIFVDRDGKRVCEVDATMLTQQFESGEISISGANTTDVKKTQTSFMKTL
ncbi:DUF1631 domain-containing protein [Draconibacterium sp.]|nr:DUF1631 domain-containing protein [Draconibacterium sp.]